ncbi:UNVERIFIED_CONTAM: hypothetical protein GTU68_033028 [Idotea baltica]|nr:hypothetical protein [Idotea baltica]
MLKEFKQFILTGNVIEFAVAVIMAGAIGLVINGFVNDIIMPVVGHFAGGVDFADLKIVLTPEVKDAAAWINTIINLLIVGFIMFLMVRSYNKMKPKPEAAPAGPSEVDLLIEIRDALKKQ